MLYVIIASDDGHATSWMRAHDWVFRHRADDPELYHLVELFDAENAEEASAFHLNWHEERKTKKAPEAISCVYDEDGDLRISRFSPEERVPGVEGWHVVTYYRAP